MDDEAAQLRKLQRLVRRKNDSPFAHIRHSKKRAYATALAITGMKGRAAELAGVHKSTPNTKQWREDRELQEALRQAEQMVGDLIEDELYRRGVEGVDKPTGWYKGKPGGYVKEYDTTAAIFLLKGLRPEKYADRSHVRSTTLHVNLTIVSDLIAKRVLPQREIRAIREGADVEATILAWVAELQKQGQEIPIGLLGSGD